MPTSTTISQSSDIKSRLAQLEELRSSGVITEEEYQAKRQKTIDEL